MIEVNYNIKRLTVHIKPQEINHTLEIKGSETHTYYHYHYTTTNNNNNKTITSNY